MKKGFSSTPRRRSEFRLTGLVLTLLTVIAMAPPAYGNAGPAFWEAYPSHQLLVVDEEASLEVKGERLVFDFSRAQGNAYDLRGEVRADYDFFNPLTEVQRVKMAFPLIGSIRDFGPGAVTITQAGHKIDFEILPGGAVSRVDSLEDFESDRILFENVLQTVSRGPDPATKALLEAQGRVYTFKVAPAGEDPVNFVLDFTFSEAATQVLTTGFNRYERRDDQVRIASWSRQEETLKVFVLGEPVDFEVKAFADGALEVPTGAFTYTVAESVEGVSHHLGGILENLLIQESVVPGDRIIEVLGKRLMENFSTQGGYSSDMDFSYDLELDRMMLLLYEVTLEPLATQEVGVAYQARATMDHRESLSPKYTVTYLLNPAGYWRSFENLSIEVLTSEDLPYMIDSSLPFEAEGDYRYGARFEVLPEKDLYFTLYEKESLTLFDQGAGRFAGHFGYFTLPVLVLGGLVLFIGVVYGIKKRRRGEQ